MSQSVELKVQIEIRSRMRVLVMGAGSASFGGRMIDYAMYKMGKDMLSKAEAIANKAAARREKVF